MKAEPEAEVLSGHGEVWARTRLDRDSLRGHQNGHAPCGIERPDAAGAIAIRVEPFGARHGCRELRQPASREIRRRLMVWLSVR